MLLSLLCNRCYKGFDISAGVDPWPSCVSFKPYQLQEYLLKSDYFLLLCLCFGGFLITLPFFLPHHENYFNAEICK